MRTHIKNGKVRYAVVGLGHIAQQAVLPAFEHTENSQLVALISSDHDKLNHLGARYQVPYLATYSDYDSLLHSGHIDAVYIALPNDMHCVFAERAAAAHVHILCEKPLALNVEQCRRMIDACDANGVHLMTAYRLHFEETNLRAREIIRSGRLGDPRFFSAVFSQQVRPGNIRTDRSRGGGPLQDIGIYCINAARMMFDDDPWACMATQVQNTGPRFRSVPEMVSATLLFPGERIATFTASQGAATSSSYRVVGTRAQMRVEPAFDYDKALEIVLESEDGRSEHYRFSRRDQFAPEIVYFSSCIKNNRAPEPDGQEGLADIQVVEGIQAAAKAGRTIEFAPFPHHRQRPSMDQEMRRRPVRSVPLVNAASPSMA